jgi:hypothetical protein
VARAEQSALYAYSSDPPFHSGALGFVKSLAEDPEVLLSEFSLVELYRLLRNPVVSKKPLSAPDAVEIIGSYRNHPSSRGRISTRRLRRAPWLTLAVRGPAEFRLSADFRRVLGAGAAATRRRQIRDGPGTFHLNPPFPLAQVAALRRSNSAGI